MKILIVTATAFEIAPLVKHLRLTEDVSQRIKRFSYGKHEIITLNTGIGMTATAFYLGKTLNQSFDFILNLGLAGSFNRNLDLGEVVNIYSDRFSELGAQDGEQFLTLAELNLPDDNAYLFSNGELVNTTVIKNNSAELLPKVNGITVNTVHGNEAAIEKTSSLFHPMVESMEGAAFLYCCKIEKLPCLQVRAISNYVEKRNKETWNIELAVKNLNQTAKQILNDF